MQMQDVQSSINSGGGGVVPGKVLSRRLNHHQPPLHQQQQPQQLTAINDTYYNHHHHHPLSQQQQQQHQQQQVALKCPRCDSSNTKFCYYNNYNLSQPRHFCKNCRRYWTKGGVLRNVPVGGGCRKSKRSSKPKSPYSSHSSTTSSAVPTTAVCSSTGGGNGGNSVYSQDHEINSSHSSRENSATAVGGGGCGGGDGIGGLFQIPEMDNFETLVYSSSNYMSLDNNNNNNKCDNTISNNRTTNNNDNENGNSRVVGGGDGAAVAEAASFSEFLRNQEWEMGKIICGAHNHDQEQEKIIGGSTAVDGLVDVVDPTVGIEDILQNRGTNVGISTLDWHLTGGNHQGLFDDVGDNSTVDHHRDYWSQSTTAVHHHHHHDPQWSDSTTGHLPLFLP